MIHHHEARAALRQTGEKFSHAAKFFRTWTEKPLQLGSVTPSSRHLSRVIASYVDDQAEGPIVEIGAGTGPITEAMIRRGIDESRLVLIEYSAEFCDLLRRRFPRATVVHGDAYTLAKTLSGVMTQKAATVVCGLPLFTKPEAQRVALLREAFTLMQPQAPFIQFTYAVVSPIPLRRPFFSWRASPRIWRNVPPARVWIYRQLPTS